MIKSWGEENFEEGLAKTREIYFNDYLPKYIKRHERMMRKLDIFVLVICPIILIAIFIWGIRS